MTLKQIVEAELDTSNILLQVAELQKVSDAVNKIPDIKLSDPTLNQQKSAFAKLVQAQLQQKKLAAQQAQQQAQQLAQQQAQLQAQSQATQTNSIQQIQNSTLVQ